MSKRYYKKEPAAKEQNLYTLIREARQLRWHKIRRQRKNRNRKARAGKNSFPPTPFLFARPSDWILKFGIRIFVKKCSNFNQKTPPIFTFCEIVRNSLGAKRLRMGFFRYFKGIFGIARQHAVGNAEVRRAKLWQNGILQTNLFSFAFSERLSVFFFDCPKTNFKTIWTT